MDGSLATYKPIDYTFRWEIFCLDGIQKQSPAGRLVLCSVFTKLWGCAMVTRVGKVYCYGQV